MRRFIVTPGICCADEWVEAESSRYDIERMGFVRTNIPEEADLLIIQGALNDRLSEWAKDVFRSMPARKKVLATGTCACGGGLFSDLKNSALESIPVDTYVTGCPPRPEALIDGLIQVFSGVEKND